jgi:hypothetical protein
MSHGIAQSTIKTITMTREELNKKCPWLKDVAMHQHAKGGGWVADTAHVDNNAYVGPDAWVGGSAQVGGRVMTIWPIGSRGGTTTYCPDNTYVCCGCFNGDINEFAKKVKETHGDNEHAKDYALAIELFKRFKG